MLQEYVGALHKACHDCNADERGLVQILQDAYKGKVQQSQAEQLAHAVAEQKIKVRDRQLNNTHGMLWQLIPDTQVASGVSSACPH